MLFSVILSLLQLLSIISVGDKKQPHKPSTHPSHSSHPRHVLQLHGGSFSHSIGLFPYHVALEDNGEYVCGGAIISKWNVLTAAHCFQYLDLSNLTIRSGTPVREQFGVIHKVKNFTMHPSFRLNRFNNAENDIAVIRVDQPFVYNTSRSGKIELFNHNEVAKPGEAAWITGWGEDETGNLSKVLKYISIPIIAKADCNNSYGGYGGIHNGEICAGTGDGTGSWHGDSGGPLVIWERLAGIVSYGEGRRGPQYPGVFTEVAYFRKWIDQYVEYDRK